MPSTDQVKLGPPPRWLKCPRKGKIIAGKFVPFKTPLCELYDSQVPEAYRFPVSMLFANLGNQRHRVGLWIDLTNTDRFYDKASVEETGCTYKKLHCRGHGECPSAEQVDAFIQLCKDFISYNPTDIIGVHCTHGFNRTGFLIVSYLVNEMGWSVEAAIQEFSSSREPGIYKQDYLNQLCMLLGDPSETIEAPDLPDWCDESEPILDDQEAEVVAGIKKPSDSSNHVLTKLPEFQPPSVSGVTALPNGSKEAKRVQTLVQQMCGWNKKGFPGSQPVSMDIQNLNLLREKEYWVSWKADGIRYLTLIEAENKIFMIDRDNNVFKVDQLRFVQRKNLNAHLVNTLLDGEMVVDQLPNGQGIPRYLIYDLVKFQNEDVGHSPLDRRLGYISQEIMAARDQAVRQGLIDKSKEPFSVRFKEFKEVKTGVAKYLNQEFQNGHPHEIDGLIFQPKDDPYIAGRCNIVLKWKPPELNTVDFKLKVVKEQREGMLPEWVGYLYVLGMDHQFTKIKVDKQLKALDGKIVECKFERNSWTFLRQRTDKSLPNSYNTAIGVCQSITNPVTKEYLLDFARSKAKHSEKQLSPAQTVSQTS